MATKVYTKELINKKIRTWDRRFNNLRPHIQGLQIAFFVTLLPAIIMGSDDFWGGLLNYLNWVSFGLGALLIAVASIQVWRYGKWIDRDIALTQREFKSVMEEANELMQKGEIDKANKAVISYRDKLKKEIREDEEN